MFFSLGFNVLSLSLSPFAIYSKLFRHEIIKGANKRLWRILNEWSSFLRGNNFCLCVCPQEPSGNLKVTELLCFSVGKITGTDSGGFPLMSVLSELCAEFLMIMIGGSSSICGLPVVILSVKWICSFSTENRFLLILRLSSCRAESLD